MAAVMSKSAAATCSPRGWLRGVRASRLVTGPCIPPRGHGGGVHGREQCAGGRGDCFAARKGGAVAGQVRLPPLRCWVAVWCREPDRRLGVQHPAAPFTHDDHADRRAVFEFDRVVNLRRVVGPVTFGSFPATAAQPSVTRNPPLTLPGEDVAGSLDVVEMRAVAFDLVHIAASPQPVQRGTTQVTSRTGGPGWVWCWSMISLPPPQCPRPLPRLRPGASLTAGVVCPWLLCGRRVLQA